MKNYLKIDNIKASMKAGYLLSLSLSLSLSIFFSLTGCDARNPSSQIRSVVNTYGQQIEAAQQITENLRSLGEISAQITQTFNDTQLNEQYATEFAYIESVAANARDQISQMEVMIPPLKQKARELEQQTRNIESKIPQPFLEALVKLNQMTFQLWKQQITKTEQEATKAEQYATSFEQAAKTSTEHTSALQKLNRDFKELAEVFKRLTNIYRQQSELSQQLIETLQQ